MKLLYKIYRILPVRIRWWISYIFAKKFLVGFCALIVNDGKLLLIKQSYQYHYSLPSGFLKQGEDLKAGIKREIKEELGLNIGISEILDTIKDSKKSIFTIIVKCKGLNGEIKVDSKELETAEFFEIDKLPLDNVLDVQLPIINQFLHNIS
ncbi:MAG: NUDIX hydrolase [Patescibacteria group bacterium]